MVIPLGGGWRTAFAGAITNLTAGGGDLDPVEMEAAFAGFDEEQLGVWVTMERWTLTGAIDQSQRFGHAVVGADELVHARQRGSAAARQRGNVDDQRCSRKQCSTAQVVRSP